MIKTQHVKSLIHNKRHWDIVCIKNSYYARCYGEGETAGFRDTGPYSTAFQAEEFITEIKKCE